MSTAHDDVLRVARTLAEVAHEGQTDKGGAAYIDHVRRVAARVEESASSEDREHAVPAAWLHDVLEDSDVTVEELAHLFPAEVVAAVVALTHRTDEPYSDYIDRVLANRIAVQIKHADLLDNTDPDRLAEMDEAARERLLSKYQPALARIREALALGS